MRTTNAQCPNCLRAVYKRPSQKNVFCDKGCYQRYYSIMGSSVTSCFNCDKMFQSKSKSAKYCSRKCANIGRTGIKYTGEQPNSKVTHNIRLKSLLKEKDGPNCKICKIEPIWNGLPLVLQLDHINGDNKDNRLENLRLLCPNCHTQTDTFGAKNIKKKRVVPVI